MKISIIAALVLGTVAGASTAKADEDRVTWTELRYHDTARQGLEPSCAAASVVTILNAQFGESLDEFQVWAAYVQSLSETQRQKASEEGLSIADMVELVEGLGYRAYAVRIDLLALNQIDRPAIVYLERSGPLPYRHFLVFDGLDGNRAILRDPSLGNRRVQVGSFMRQWQGHAVFIDRTG